jgi:threonine synthase
VDGTYDQAFDLSIEASLEFGWYNRNTGYNP